MEDVRKLRVRGSETDGRTQKEVESREWEANKHYNIIA